MSDLSTMIKRFILPVIFASVAFQIPVQANTVRILGPAADEQPATIVGVSQDSTQNRSSATRYGPTANSETLWSIASRNRPNNQVSVYQVIGAIHRANPQAFEQNNIHGLLPGSVLTIPGLAQIRQENVDSVKRRLAADQQRQSRQASTSAPARAPAPKVNKQEPTVVAQPLPKPDVAKEEVVSQSVATSQSTRGGIPLKPTALQEQLDASDVQMTKLLESNHLLRVRLAEMQHEVTALRDQVSSDDVLRDQIKGFIEQQKAQPIEPVVAETSWLDSLIANPLALAAVAFIPGSLIAGLLAFFMLRRKKDDADDVKSLDSPEQKPAMVPPPADSDDAIPDLALSDDNDLDDLFGGDDESLFDDPEKSLFPSETDKSSDSIDMLDLSTDSDEFEIDSGLTSSSISVKGDEQAIGLQDMERALDEMEQTTEQSSDEALAAMWEQSLQSESDDEESFDLSDDSLSSLDDSLLDEQKIEDGFLDQSILDDLLSEVDMEQDSQAQAVEEDVSQQVVDQDELDSLFDTVGMADVPEPSVDTVTEAVEETEELAQQAAVDQALAEADAMFAVETEAVDVDDVDDIDALFEANSTALLDDLIEDDELSSDIEVEENSTALLDELLEDDDTKDFLNPAVSIDENSTALLDELVEDLDSELVDEDSYGSVAPDAVKEGDESPNIDDVVIDENSTDLLDDILAQHSVQPDLEPEPKVSVPEAELQEPDILSGDSSFVSSEKAEPETFSTDFLDPEFEPVYDSEVVSSQQSQTEPDADFPEPEQSAFAEIFNDVLDEQSNVADSEPEQTEEPMSDPQAELTQEPAQEAVQAPVLEPEFDTELQEGELSQQPEPVEAEEIDALLADVEGLLDEPDVDDVVNLERSVDELLDSIEHQPEQPVHADDNAQAEADLEQAILSGAGYDDLPASDEEVVLADSESLSAEEALDISQSGEESPEVLSVEDALREEQPQAEEPSVEESLEERLPETVLPEDTVLVDQQPEAEALESVFDPVGFEVEVESVEPELAAPESVTDSAVEPLSLDDFPEFDEEAAFNDPEAESAQQAEELPPVDEPLAEYLPEEVLSEGLTLAEQPFESEAPEPVNLDSVVPEPITDDAVEPLSLDDWPEFDEEAAFNDPEAEAAQPVEELPEASFAEDALLEEQSPVEESLVADSLEERLPETELPEDGVLAEQQSELETPEPVIDHVDIEPVNPESVAPELTASEITDLEFESDDAVEPLTLDDLPEFDEEAAFNDPEAEALEEMQSLLSDDEEQVALDNIVKQLQQAAEAAQPVEALPEASLPVDERLEVSLPEASFAEDALLEDQPLVEESPVAESLEEQLSEAEHPEDEVLAEQQSELETPEPVIDHVDIEPVNPESVAPELTASEITDLEFESDDAVEPLTLDDLPEFDEEAAFNDPEAEALEEMLSPLSDDEEQVAFDNIVKQVQQAAEAAQPESAALATESASSAPASIHGEQQIAFESIDPDSLPEFSEDEALQASFDEQHELEQYEVEQGLKEPQTAKTPQAELPTADMFDDELVDSAGLDMAALLSDPEEVLADVDSVMADSVSEAPPIEPQAQEEEHSAYDTDSEEAAVIEPERDADIESEPVAESLQQDVVSEDVREPSQAAPVEYGFDKADFIDTNTNVDFQDELEAEREQLLSDSFGGDEQLAGFSGSDLEMPEEDSEIWAQTSPEPVLESENWADQPQMLIEDVAAFDAEMLLAEAESQALLQDVAGSELVDEPNSPSYISIDELMKDLEPENPIELDDEPLNLEVGLDEFPDVLSDVAAFDVDSQGEYASKLDLAKAYLEMNDSEGALGLLEEVASNGDAQIKREAKGLLEKIRVPRS